MPAPITPGGEPTDDIFAESTTRPTDFTFDATTVRVFDNMVSRSVPFYGEIQRMTAELAAEFAVPGTTVYDLGCSTGTTFLALEPQLDPSIANGSCTSASRTSRTRVDGVASSFCRARAIISGELS